MSDTVTEKAGEATEQVTPNGNGDRAKKLLIPAAAGVGTLAATYAATKVPGLFKDKVMPRLEEKGGEEAAKVGKNAAANLSSQGGVLGAVAGKVAGGGKSGGGREKTRRLPIQRWTDVAVPVEEAYQKWVDFEEYPKFMHRVLNVEHEDAEGDEPEKVKWEEKIWFSKRQWEGKITDQRENDRIAWTTESGTSHTGIVSFHKLDDNLTRVLVTVDFQPAGMIEKMASGLRFVKRAVQSDLARFKAYVELDDAKGVEYEVAPSKDDQQDEDDDQKAQGDDDRKAQLDDESGDDDSEDRESEREEREERRRQRRETTTAA
jgi:uncharacterized membrane protein